jgi:hypothetical protein
VLKALDVAVPLSDDTPIFVWTQLDVSAILQPCLRAMLIKSDHVQLDISIEIHNGLNLSDQVDMIGPFMVDVIAHLPFLHIRHHSPSRGT